MNRIFFIDCETLSLRENAVLLSVGITWVAPDENNFENLKFSDILSNGFYAKVDRKQQLGKGRDVTESCLEWWKGQSNEAKNVLKSTNLMTVEDFHKSLKKYLDINEYNLYNTHLWSKSCKDYGIISSLFDDFLLEPLFLHRNVRDTITALTLLGEEYMDIEVKGGVPYVKHNALHDAAYDAYRFINILK